MSSIPAAQQFPAVLPSRWSSDEHQDQFPVENPATGEMLTLVQGAGVAEVDAAVHAADHAFETDWRWRPPRERGRILLDCAAVLRRHADDLARLETLENGKPYSQSRNFDVELLIGSFEFFGAIADKVPGEFIDGGAIANTVRLEPYGVVAGIIPFNWPPIHTGGKAAPALAVGNTVVLKPGEQAPLTIIRIVEILQDVLPADVLHVVPGYGPVCGRALVSHQLVRKISFTGSTPTGAAVLKTAAENITPALVELGGNNAFIVLADANLDAAVAGAVEGGFFNQGEACTASARVLVHQSMYDEFVRRLAAAVERLVVGDGLAPETHVGPLVTRAHQQKVLSHIEGASRDGAKIAAQARLPSDPRLRAGFFVPPTLFVDCRSNMRIWRDEVFGPVVCVMPFADFDEAIALANDTEFGLVAAVYTTDHDRAMRACRLLDVGVVFVNNFNRAILGTPFGGAKASGYGREHSVQTLKEFGRSKLIREPSGTGLIPHWFAVDDVLGK